MVPICCRVAETRREIDDALRLRWAVFGEELGLLSARPAQREMDDFDTLETTIHIVAYGNGVPVATGRVLLPNEEVARARGWGVGLDVEGRFDLGSLAGAGVTLAEVTRICVLQPFRGGSVTVALLAAMLLEGQRRGVTHCVAAVNTQTDVAEDAAIIAQAAAQRHRVSPHYCVCPRTLPSPPHPPQAPLYTEEMRRRAAGGDTVGLRFPLAVEAATRMGLRLAGPAMYDVRFRRFAVPLVGVMDEIAVGIPTHRAA